MKPNQLVNGETYLYTTERFSQIKTAEYCAMRTNMHKCPVFKINNSKSLWTYLYAQKRDIEQYILPRTKLWRLLYED